MFSFFVPVFMSGYAGLIAAALIPPLLLMIYIYRLDKIEREPMPLIIRLFIFGALSVLVAGTLESILQAVLLGGPFAYSSTTLQRFVLYFIVVALVEEGVKWFVLRMGTWNSPAFDYRFDAIVYSVAVTLGFAALENVMYVMQYGFGNAIGRALTSIPGHCIFGIFMGYYYGMAKMCRIRGDMGRSRYYTIRSLLIPVILHGLYDFCATSENEYLVLFFFAYIIALDVVAFIKVRKFAREDQPL